jgi:hypothetical protein
MALCVNEKSHVQALDRTQPLLPVGLGDIEGVTHNYKRHETTTKPFMRTTPADSILAKIERLCKGILLGQRTRILEIAID